VDYIVHYLYYRSNGFDICAILQIASIDSFRGLTHHHPLEECLFKLKLTTETTFQVTGPSIFSKSRGIAQNYVSSKCLHSFRCCTDCWNATRYSLLSNFRMVLLDLLLCLCVSFTGTVFMSVCVNGKKNICYLVGSWKNL